MMTSEVPVKDDLFYLYDLIQGSTEWQIEFLLQESS